MSVNPWNGEVDTVDSKHLVASERNEIMNQIITQEFYIWYQLYIFDRNTLKHNKRQKNLIDSHLTVVKRRVVFGVCVQAVISWWVWGGERLRFGWQSYCSVEWWVATVVWRHAVTDSRIRRQLHTFTHRGLHYLRRRCGLCQLSITANKNTSDVIISS